MVQVRPPIPRVMPSKTVLWKIFQDWPEALDRILEIARRCTFSLDELAYDYDELSVGGRDAEQPPTLPTHLRAPADHLLPVVLLRAQHPEIGNVFPVNRVGLPIGRRGSSWHSA